VALNSLRTRLVTAAVVITALATTAVVVLLQVLLARASDADSTALARERVAAAATTVVVRNGQVTAAETPADSLDRDVWVFDASGRLVDGVLPKVLHGQVTGLAAAGREQLVVTGDTRLAARPVGEGGRTVAMVVAAVDLRPYEDSERRGLLFSLLLGAFAVLVSGVAASEAARFTLGRVHHMVAQAHAWEEHDLDQRFGLGKPSDAFSELGHTLDHMLNRIAAALRSERRLTDELAHELRTPLTVIRGEAELALTTTPDDPTYAVIIGEVQRAEASIDAMLDAARARVEPAVTHDLAEVLRDAAGGRARVEAPAGLEVGVGAGQLLAMLAPLLDNASRHASSTITIAAREDGGRVVVAVVDDGPGVAAGDLERIFEPGQRSGDGGTAGLGLAVVRRLAHAAGGEATALAGPGGRFELSLPGA
jgi:two-component system OmpR family sensor kinase